MCNLIVGKSGEKISKKKSKTPRKEADSSSEDEEDVSEEDVEDEQDENAPAENDDDEMLDLAKNSGENKKQVNKQDEFLIPPPPKPIQKPAIVSDRPTRSTRSSRR